MVGDGAHDQGEGDGAGVGGADTLLSVRSGSAHPRHQALGRVSGVLGGRAPPGLDRRAAGSSGLGEGVVDGDQHIDEGLVTDFSAPKLHDCLACVTQRGGKDQRRGPISVAEA